MISSHNEKPSESTLGESEDDPEIDDFLERKEEKSESRSCNWRTFKVKNDKIVGQRM